MHEGKFTTQYSRTFVEAAQKLPGLATPFYGAGEERNVLALPAWRNAGWVARGLGRR